MEEYEDEYGSISKSSINNESMIRQENDDYKFNRIKNTYK